MLSGPTGFVFARVVATSCRSTPRGAAEDKMESFIGLVLQEEVPQLLSLLPDLWTSPAFIHQPWSLLQIGTGELKSRAYRTSFIIKRVSLGTERPRLKLSLWG
jgi:hypothetical protein